MAKVNHNFDNLVPNYLFAEIAKRVNEYVAEHPDNHLIRLGIGDVTLPLAPAVVEAMKKGCDELGNKETFKGYPDYEGYAFLREAISGYYKSFGVEVAADEILVNDGAKSDAGNIGDIFSQDNVVLVNDPVYPVYVDSNIMSGRKSVKLCHFSLSESLTEGIGTDGCFHFFTPFSRLPVRWRNSCPHYNRDARRKQEKRENLRGI